MTDPRDPALIAHEAQLELGTISRDEWAEGDTQELARRLLRLDELAAAVRELRADIADTLTGSMEVDEMIVPGVGVLRRSETTTSTWNHNASAEMLREDLAAAITAEVATDIATGEIDEMKRNVARATMRAAYDVIPSFSSIKAAGPKRFGVRISDYRSYGVTYKVAVQATGEPS